MPRRNLLILVLVTLVSLLCYHRAEKNRYGRVLADAMTTIENRSLDPVEPLKLFEGAMEGMVNKLDDYSAYIPPAELQQFHEEIDQEFGGLGMEVILDLESKQLMVLSPLVGSPAYRAGILAGDRILKIGSSSTQGMSLTDAVALLRGKPGDPVTLRVLHEGLKEPVEVTLVREVIQVDTVLGDTRNADGSWNFFLQGSDRIGYVRITCFTDQTVPDLRRALDWLQEHKMVGLVLDLRDDPGGYLDAAIDICNMFIDSGVIVTTRRRDGRISRAYEADRTAQFTGFPMAVLVNSQTASAAEIIAACLQDHHRAVIVGQRSFGKGTVQELIDLQKGCGALKLSTSSYWRPSGKNIHRARDADEDADWGVSPDKDFVVAQTPEQQNRWRLWRARRDVFPSAAVNGLPPDEAKSGAKPFVDETLLRAVEYIEKEATAKPAAA